MSEGFNERELRENARRALQLMNQYSLMEFEFEHKEEERSLTLRRSDTDSSPPLLEGRSKRLPGQVRAPTLGQLEWEREAGQPVEKGERVGHLVKQDEEVPLKAPIAGDLTDLWDGEYVEFGDVLATIVPRDEEEDEE